MPRLKSRIVWFACEQQIFKYIRYTCCFVRCSHHPLQKSLSFSFYTISKCLKYILFRRGNTVLFIIRHYCAHCVFVYILLICIYYKHCQHKKYYIHLIVMSIIINGVMRLAHCLKILIQSIFKYILSKRKIDIGWAYVTLL